MSAIQPPHTTGSPAAQKALAGTNGRRRLRTRQSHQHGLFLEIDEVIDPMDSRRWIIAALNAVSKSKSKYAQKEGRGFVDTW